ncbi:MAG: hypothetical protein CSH37_14475 [Thalassolituus sp.]|nr:MAG: hypothetical protein CSH37_14475 [Thalassolituus sp.]
MEVFEQAQQTYPQVRFVMLNQGESRADVLRFIESKGYQFDNLWLDPQSQMGRWLGQSALPVTLVFDRRGALISGHMGATSGAVIAQLLSVGLNSEPVK